MPDKDPWADCETTFVTARAIIRAAQDEVAAEHRRQAEIDSIAAPATSPNSPFTQVLRGRVPVDGGQR